MQNLAAADEVVSQQKKLIDIQQKNDLSVLVAYDHEIIMLLKCIVILVLFKYIILENVKFTVVCKNKYRK